MTDQQNQTPPPATSAIKVETRRDQDFLAFYANNVIVESNAFDLKLILGLYDHRNATQPAIDQFASVNLSWPQVKLLIFWMQVHLAGYERDNGKVKIPASALPPDLGSLPSPFDNAQGREQLEFIRKMRAEFIATLKD